MHIKAFSKAFCFPPTQVGNSNCPYQTNKASKNNCLISQLDTGTSIFGGYFKPSRAQDKALQDTLWGKIWIPGMSVHPQQST